MITFDNVTKIYNSNVGLENASIHIKKGDFVFLVGPSGAGKSTFIKLILKEINADKGSIKVDGQEVTTLSNREIPKLRRKIGIVFQDFRLLPKKTVYENVAFAMEILHKSKRQIRKKVPQVLSLVGISDKADKYPDELSAGEQQRVAIARAIINNPIVLIADEPTGNLDPDTASEIMDLLNQINLTGTTIVMVTHAKDIVDRMQKRVVAIESGHIVRDEFGQYGYEEENCGEEPEAETALGSETPLGEESALGSEALLEEMKALARETLSRETAALERKMLSRETTALDRATLFGEMTALEEEAEPSEESAQEKESEPAEEPALEKEAEPAEEPALEKETAPAEEPALEKEAAPLEAAVLEAEEVFDDESNLV